MTDDRSYDEPLPWLQAVEDEDEPRGLSARRMFAALVVVLFAGLIVAGAFFWLGRRDTAVGGAPELIQAPPGPYKVKPPDPGGLDIRGESETAFETSAGEDQDSKLDLGKLAEVPVAKPAKAEPKVVPAEEKAPAASEQSPNPSRPARQEASSSSAPSPIRRRRSGRGQLCRRASRRSPRRAS